MPTFFEADVIVLGIGAGLSPAPNVVQIVLAASGDTSVGRRVTAAVAWFAGLAGSFIAVSLLIDSVTDTAEIKRDVMPSIEVGAAIVLLLIAVLAAVQVVRFRRGGDARDDHARIPGLGWVEFLDRVGHMRIAFVMVCLAVINPKNLAITIGAAGAGDGAAAGIGYGLAGSVTLTLLAVPQFTRAKPVSAALSRLHRWLVRHQAAIVLVAGLVGGAYLLVLAARG